MKLVQYSTPGCNPCRIAQRYIKDNYPNLDYNVINVRNLEEDNPLHYKNFPITVRGVPRFITVDKDNKFIEDIGSGFSLRADSPTRLKLVKALADD